ncbi:hypothetical protein B7R22_00090 [Subtercola boreus]|uniref:Alpha/beta hydrolase n=2 Tax=Subtercola boreus TaxID=120213 RepID=A0A3E0W504_9MICO|nr:hypothetical protein B7R22_00090 [Subtercola boreus]
MLFTIVPGSGSSGPEHWQTLWEAELPVAVRIAPPSWDDHDPADWSRALDVAADLHGCERAVLVAHSFGCLVAVDWAARNSSRVAGLFLVAPPDRRGIASDIITGLDHTDDIRLVVPAEVLVSTDDPYCSTGRALELARAWGAVPRVLGALGHINAASGLEAWPEGRRMLDEFVLTAAGRPAVPPSFRTSPPQSAS